VGKRIDGIFTLHPIDGDGAPVDRVYDPVGAAWFRVAAPAISFVVFHAGCGSARKGLLHRDLKVGS